MFGFDANSEQYHRHQKGVKLFFALVFQAKLCQNSRDRYEDLFHVVSVDRKGVEVSKNIPVGQMCDQTDDFVCACFLNLALCLLYC